MTIFYNQPTAHRFGTELIKELDAGIWNVFEIGVAWVRRSGTQHMLMPLHNFLQRGGVFRISVGIDIYNTSKEGLEDLLFLKESGAAEISVYHDEGDPTFHPKVFLFYNEENAKLIVGSNNITGAGLFVNVEAGLEINGSLRESVIQDALFGLASWRDSTNKLALPLDANLLDDLFKRGYVLPETSLPRPARKPLDRSAETAKALFGRSKVVRPPLPFQRIQQTSENVVSVNAGIGKVLLMRVRKASITDRPTQTQIPKKVLEDPFFLGINSITSAHDGRSHNIITAEARGIINTMKLEIPEMRNYEDPVVRFERTADAIIYQAFDSSSVLGRPIIAALNRGLDINPQVTKLTKPSNPDSSTWWRFI